VAKEVVQAVVDDATTNQPSTSIAQDSNERDPPPSDNQIVFTVPVDSCPEKSNNGDSDATIVSQTCATSQQLTSINVASKDEGYYPVEKILDCRRKADGSREFKIKWAGYNNCHNSWQPEANLDGCVQTLKNFLANNPQFGTTTKLKQRVVLNFKEN